MRLFPNMTVMAPGDEADVVPMLRWSLEHSGPTSIRYPKANLERIDRPVSPIGLGQAEVYEWGEDGVFVAYGTLFSSCVRAAQRLRQEDGLNIGVINARFVKPLDRVTLLKAVDEQPLVVTVEEGTLEGGFGSALLEAANSAGMNTSHVVRLGLPDRFVEHGERHELLAELGLDVDGLCASVRRALGRPKRGIERVATGM
jgi:1-deoxy-D-xylulose-5-phosphate synthase